jgi:hypothetical protein
MASMIKPIAPKQQAETRSAVERIGAFAAAARPEHLTTDIRQLLRACRTSIAMEGLLARNHRDARCLRRFPRQTRFHRSKGSLRRALRSVFTFN